MVLCKSKTSTAICLQGLCPDKPSLSSSHLSEISVLLQVQFGQGQDGNRVMLEDCFLGVGREVV